MVNKSIDNIKRMTTQINDQPAKKIEIEKIEIKNHSKENTRFCYKY